MGTKTLNALMQNKRAGFGSDVAVARNVRLERKTLAKFAEGFKGQVLEPMKFTMS